MVDLNKVLITGAEGAIGSEIDFGIKLSRSELDITNPNSIKSTLKKYIPSAVLNLASVNLKNSEDNPGLAIAVNAIGTYNLAVETKSNNVPLIIISSGAIFNGSINEEFNENSLPIPLNIYGQTKYLAEILARSNNKTIIVRTGWLFGFKKKENFFNKIFSAAKKGEEIVATSDQYGSFIYIEDLIKELKKIIVESKPGIYHIVNDEKATAFDLARFLVASLKSKSPIKESSIKESIIKRSPSEVLVSNFIKLRGWKQAIKEYL